MQTQSKLSVINSSTDAPCNVPSTVVELGMDMGASAVDKGSPVEPVV